MDAHVVKLDVANAGVALDHGGLTREKFWQTYEANVIAPYFITQAPLPLLKASPARRIVNQSSIMGSATAMSDPNSVPPEMVAPAYFTSKAALNMLTVATTRTLEGSKVKANSAHPGWVKTDMGTERGRSASLVNLTKDGREGIAAFKDKLARESSLVTLYKALGGGWNESSAENPS